MYFTRSFDVCSQEVLMHFTRSFDVFYKELDKKPLIKFMMCVHKEF